jgi:hypothetical protein
MCKIVCTFSWIGLLTLNLNGKKSKKEKGFKKADKKADG